jgi:2-polyprenyl-6-methoxyphenol hydroxylase-like FAD-dependent oxidoreductase
MIKSNSYFRGKVTIIGGSIGGLLAGNVFHRMGWDVQIYERVADNLEGRGAGITILPGLIEGFHAAGVNETEQSLGIELPARIALDQSGKIVAEREFSQVMTSWNRLYEALKNVFPSERYHQGINLEHIEQDDKKVTACFTGGTRVDADLLIGADGLRSAVRSQFLPEVKPYYPGYIAWRCLTDERDLSSATHETLFNRYSVCVAPGQQGIGYPVPGPGNSKVPGERQYNVVWYQPASEDYIRDLMTDDSGHHHANGISPALLSARVKGNMQATAAKVLAPQFAEAIAKGKWIFFQPILDLELTRMVFGRVAIVGDAAFITRPHVAMGVPKGAGDVLALANAIKNGGDDFLLGLAQFEAERLRVSHNIVARGRYLGSYMEAQLKSEEERRNAEIARVPARVMIETAAPMNYV